MSPLKVVIFLLLVRSIWTFIHILSCPKNECKLSPGPQPLPIIGNLHMLGSYPHRGLQSLAQKYTPLFMSLRLCQVPNIGISSSQATELILKTHDTVFASRPIFQASKVIGMSKGIAFTEYGPYWRSHRELITLQLLSASKIESFSPIRK